MDSLEESDLDEPQYIQELDRNLDYCLTELKTVVDTLEDLEEVPTTSETHIERRMKGKWEINTPEVRETYRSARKLLEQDTDPDYSDRIEDIESKKAEIEEVVLKAQSYDLLDDSSRLTATDTPYRSRNTV
ncbi:MAG: hypothetical protein ACI9LV_000888 [Candidatus Nanohaloarchaea archaeon]|jgi:hypothetical protein